MNKSDSSIYYPPGPKQKEEQAGSQSPDFDRTKGRTSWLSKPLVLLKCGTRARKPQFEILSK